MWDKKGEYYLSNGNWTICRTGKDNVRYGLFNGSVNHGWFATSKEAMDKWDEIKNE